MVLVFKAFSGLIKFLKPTRQKAGRFKTNWVKLITRVTKSDGLMSSDFNI